MAELSDIPNIGDVGNAAFILQEQARFLRDNRGTAVTGGAQAGEPGYGTTLIFIIGRGDLPVLELPEFAAAFYLVYDGLLGGRIPDSLDAASYVGLVNRASAFIQPGDGQRNGFQIVSRVPGGLSTIFGGVPMSIPQADLARALIASGQLRLGPEAFQTPEAMAALRAALAGGSMSSSWFGLGGISPGGTTPFNPFGAPTFVDGGGGGILPDAVGGGSILGSLASALPGILTGLAQAGVIRGSVGNFLAPMQQMAAAAPMQQFVPIAGLPASVAGLLNLTPTQVMAGGSLALDAMQMLSGLFGGGSSGRGPVDAPSLFRMTASGTRLPARQQVRGPDGSLYIIQSLGKATRGSREISAMRRLANTNGYTVARRGTRGRGRGRRRPY